MNYKKNLTLHSGKDSIHLRNNSMLSGQFGEPSNGKLDMWCS